jgi:hypothetical protein
MDSKLQWKEHLDEVRRKATKTVNALSCLGGSTWGVTFADVRKLYEATALPQMMYACSIWSNASTKGKTYTKKTLNILQSIQARAARSICGAYKATSRAALDIEAYLLPIEQQIWRHNADLITRLLSCKHIADISGLQRRRPQLAIAGRPTVRHSDSWQKMYDHMASQRRQDFDAQEFITPFITPPWRQGPRAHIHKAADKARSRHNREHEKGQSRSIYRVCLVV